MNKKGMLEKEVPKIVIAIFVLFFLFGTSSKAYAMWTTKQEAGQAEGTLEELIAKVDQMNAENLDKEQVYLLSPAEWCLLNGEDAYAGQLCLCPDAEFSSCSKGVCKKVGWQFRIDKKIEVFKGDQATQLSISRENSIFVFSSD